STTGYVLIAELEQVYAAEFENTLCVVFSGNDPATSKPNVDEEGFYSSATGSCRSTKWNPSDPVNGLPTGDWCAATNSAATAGCRTEHGARGVARISGARHAGGERCRTRKESGSAADDCLQRLARMGRLGHRRAKRLVQGGRRRRRPQVVRVRAVDGGVLGRQ